MFKNALRSSVIRLRVIRPLSTSPTIPTATDAQPSNSTNVTDRVNNLRNCQQPSPDTGDQNAVTSVIKIPPAVPPRNASTTLSAAKNKFTQISSTRLIGKVINIELTKGDDHTFLRLSDDGTDGTPRTTKTAGPLSATTRVNPYQNFQTHQPKPSIPSSLSLNLARYVVQCFRCRTRMQNSTSSSAVLERQRDALCPSVVSLIKMITRAESFIIVT